MEMSIDSPQLELSVVYNKTTVFSIKIIMIISTNTYGHEKDTRSHRTWETHLTISQGNCLIFYFILFFWQNKKSTLGTFISYRKS